MMNRNQHQPFGPSPVVWDNEETRQLMNQFRSDPAIESYWVAEMVEALNEAARYTVGDWHTTARLTWWGWVRDVLETTRAWDEGPAAARAFTKAVNWHQVTKHFLALALDRNTTTNTKENQQ